MRRLALCVLLEKYLRIPFCIYAEGQLVPDVPWHWLSVRLSAPEIVELMDVCAEAGARHDLLFLNEVLEKIQP
jgi:hypothetical protein